MGQEKGLVHLSGKPMIQYPIEATSSLMSPQYIIAHHPGYAEFGLKVFPDIKPGLGPLGGIYTALTHCGSSRAMVLSCDCPLISTDTLQSLLNHSAQGLVLGSIENNINPFPGIYPKSLLPKLESTLNSGRLKVQDFIREQPHELVQLQSLSKKPQQEFLNFNTPEAVTDWEKSQSTKPN